MIRVKKRDGRIVPFDEDKIKNTIQEAFRMASVEDDLSASEYVLTKLIEYITLMYSEDNYLISIEEMLDVVEDILKYFDRAAARAFIKERFYKEMEHRFRYLFEV